MPHEKAVSIIEEGKRSHFDPDITDAFLELHEVFRSIAAAHPDEDEDIQKKADYLSLLTDTPQSPLG